MSIKKSTFNTLVAAGLLLNLSVFSTVSAKEISIYRWVDHNDVVHFSQNLPQHDQYKEFSTISSYHALSKAERKIMAEQEISEREVLELQKREDDINAKNKAMFEKNCKAARLNIKMLNTLDNVHISEEAKDGSIVNRPMTPKEREEKMTLSKKHEKTYCDK